MQAGTGDWSCASQQRSPLKYNLFKKVRKKFGREARRRVWLLEKRKRLEDRTLEKRLPQSKSITSRLQRRDSKEDRCMGRKFQRWRELKGFDAGRDHAAADRW
jgi:hypothetical protein